MLLGGQKAIEAECAAERHAQLIHGRVRHFVLRLRGEHEGDERRQALILHPSTIKFRREKKKKKKKKPVERIAKRKKRTRGSISFHLAVSQPIVSTGAGNRERISLMESYVSRQPSGAGCGLSRACLIVLGFRGDADAEGVVLRPDLAFFPLSAAGAAPALVSDETVNSPSAASSTLTRFERRGGGVDDGPGSSKSPSEFSSLNKVTEGFVGLC